VSVALAAPFKARGEHLAVALGGGARVLFTSRLGGMSSPPYASLNLGRFTDDDPAVVDANRDRLAALSGVPRGRTLEGRQVHGRAVARVGTPPDPAAPLADADGQATGLRGVAALVLTADCLPIALAADGAVAMLHGGWRGLAGGIVAEGVAALREVGGTGAIEAAIGPAAGPCCYEVGAEVHGAFVPALVERDRAGRTIDLPEIAARLLADAGVERVHRAGVCTICDERFFSHRRDGVTGRQAGMAWWS